VIGLGLMVAVAALVYTSRSGDSGGEHQTAAAFGHVHGLAVDERTGVLYAATHTGLFRIDGEKAAARVSRDGRDLMGFTAVGSGHFLASGHPEQHQAPANLGLIESTDGGVTWTTLSLSGAADFHGLWAAHGSVYGYNSNEGTFMVSTDRRTWERRSTAALGAFAVSPTDAATVIAVGRTGLQRSTDGGRGWQTIPNTPQLTVLTWEPAGDVWGVSMDAGVWRSTDGGSSWQQRGRVSGRAQAITIHESTVYVAVAGDEIMASSDGGATWNKRYAPG
jgi:photosystem II stability/assembly factor-like uncharacterized protein